MNGTVGPSNTRMDQMAIDSKNNAWLISGGGIVRCDDSWSCIEMDGDWTTPLESMMGGPPLNIAVDTYGDGPIVYVRHTHDYKRCIQNESGNFSCYFLGTDGGENGPAKMTVDSEGNLFVISDYSHELSIWDNALQKFRSVVDGPTDDMVVDSQGQVYVHTGVTDFYPHTNPNIVKKCTPVGVCSDFYVPQFLFNSIAVGLKDDVYVLEDDRDVAGYQLTQCSPDGACTNLGLLQVSNPLTGAVSMIFDQNGVLYLTTSYAGVFRVCLPSLGSDVYV